jgi:hypothetical protein
MKKIMMVAILFALVSAPAFSQSNATLFGVATDATQAVLPGVTVKATNTETGIAKTAVTNAAGVYTFSGMQVGTYEVTAELSGFQTHSFKGVALGNSAQIRLNFTMEIKKLEQSVEVSIQADNLSLDTGASSGSKLDEKKVGELPIVNSNVLSLIKVMGGVTVSENPIFGADDTQFAGVSASNINLTRDGVSASDVRWATGLNSPVYLNPEMVGEFKMVLAPVDAEMGRGNGQVSVVTRSGGNAYHGSGVWNNQNSALDANQWLDNKSGRVTDWRNQNEYTISVGGPIIKNKTFFFASWDQQFYLVKQNASSNYQSPTPCARKGIWRYMSNVSGGNVLTVPGGSGTATSPYTAPVTDTAGVPLTTINLPGGATTPGTLNYLGLFGKLLKTPTTNDCSDVAVDSATGLATSAWVNYGAPYDPLRTPDASGYMKRFMPLIPTPNNYRVGDGLNWGGFQYVRRLSGVDNVYGIGEGPNRKQINFRIDHNFSAMHRVSGTYSWEHDRAEDAFPTMPTNSWGGAVLRTPQNFSVNFVSTLRPTLLNEARIGLTRTESSTYDPYYNPVNGDQLKNKLLELYPNSANIPILVSIGNFGIGTGNGGTNGMHPFGSGRGNQAATWGGYDPRWVYADTLTWTKGRHSMRFGAEMQRVQSYQNQRGLISFATGAWSYPSAYGGAFVATGAFGANTGLTDAAGNPSPAAMPNAAGGIFGGIGYGNVVSGAYQLMNTLAGNITTVNQWRFVNSPTATTYNDVGKGEDERFSDVRANQLSFFMQDDWRITDSFTFNLGLRYDWYGVPYLKGGMTNGIKGGALAAFGRSGSSFADWMQPGTMNADGSVTYKGTDASLAFIGPDSPNPDQNLYNDDYNNIGPVFGFAWQLPWFGKGKTVLRGGYQMSYMPPGRLAAATASAPKIESTITYQPNATIPYINLSNISSISPTWPSLTVTAGVKPVAADPLFPVSQRSLGITVYDPNIVTPYVQNLNLSLTRNITSNITLDMRYIGTLQRKGQSGVNLNAANIWNNGLKEAFDAARYGGESALLDKMFNGVNLVGTGYGPVGTTTSAGVKQTGAMHLRAATSTYTSLANGNYIGLAGVLATLNYNTGLTGNSTLPAIDTNAVRGSILRYNNFPENFIYTSPQFSSVTLNGNNTHSNYHSLQTQVTIRPTHGFNLQVTHTWAKNLGNLTVTDVRNRALDYGANGQDRRHALAINGAFELPFGPGRWLLNGNNGLLSRAVGGWQMSWIGNIYSGPPFTLSSTVPQLYGAGVPNQVGPFDRTGGKVVWNPGASSGGYFWDEFTNAAKYVLIKDPQCSNLTTSQSLQTRCTLWAFADASTLVSGAAGPDTKYIFVNPYPTERGNFQQSTLRRPNTWSADMAMMKSVKLTEGKSLQIRVDATNIFNHTNPSGYSASSGVGRVVVPSAPAAAMTYYSGSDASYALRPLGYIDAKVGARTFQAKVRIDF